MDQVELATFVDAVAAGDAYVLDVRETPEFAAGHVPGAVSMPLALIPLRESEIPSGQSIFVICETGARAAQAGMFLARKGISSANVMGGMVAWRQAGLAQATGLPAWPE